MKTDYYNIISTVLNENSAQWKSICINGITYTAFALGYTQLELPSEGYAFVDSYYVASNRAYFLRKELCEKLTAAGFETVSCDLPYKNIAYCSGLGTALKSTLIANELFGTRMALEIVGVKGVYADKAELCEVIKKPEISEICRSCSICERLCPGGCISIDGFERESCIRSMQESSVFPDDRCAKAAGVQLWGCDICQRYCPFNKHLPTRAMTDREKELYLIDNLYANFSMGKKGCEPYRDILGGNYLRPSKLMALTLNVMANSSEPQKYIKCAEEMKSHADERVRTAAERLLNKADRK